jgi:hypothetical protein
VVISPEKVAAIALDADISKSLAGNFIIAVYFAIFLVDFNRIPKPAFVFL